MTLDTRISTGELKQLVGPLDFDPTQSLGDLALVLDNAAPAESRLMAPHDVDNSVADRVTDLGFAATLREVVPTDYHAEHLARTRDPFEQFRRLTDRLYSMGASEVDELNLSNPLNIKTGYWRAVLACLRGKSSERRNPYYIGDTYDERQSVGRFYYGVRVR